MKHLRYFDALARKGHFGQAAESCAISQPALSLQIKEFEDILGAQLVERGGKQIHLTALGREIAMRAGDILRSVDDLDALARATQGPMGGRLRIGVIPTVAPYLLPRLIRGLAARYPEMDIRPREAMTHKLTGELTDGNLDVAVLALPVQDPTLEAVALLQEEFLLVRHADQAGLPAPGTDNLAEMRLLLLEEGHCFRDQALAVCHLGPDPSGDLMEGNSLSTLVQMVDAGIGVTLIPEMAVPVETRLADVAITRLAAPRPKRSIGLVWRKSNPAADQLREIAGVFRHILGQGTTGDA